MVAGRRGSKGYVLASFILFRFGFMLVPLSRVADAGFLCGLCVGGRKD